MARSGHELAPESEQGLGRRGNAVACYVLSYRLPASWHQSAHGLACWRALLAWVCGPAGLIALVSESKKSARKVSRGPGAPIPALARGGAPENNFLDFQTILRSSNLHQIPVNEINRRIGEGHPRHKYSDATVEFVRDMHETGMSMAIISRLIGMPYVTVRSIISGRTRSQTAVDWRETNEDE